MRTRAAICTSAIVIVALSGSVQAAAEPPGPNEPDKTIATVADACGVDGVVIEVVKLPSQMTIPACALDVAFARGAARVPLPPPGGTITNESLTVDGTSPSLRASLDHKGTLTLSDPAVHSEALPESPPPSESTFSAAALDRCSDGKYTLNSDFYSVHPYTYTVNTSSTPGGVIPTDWLAAVKAASETWYLQRNSCAFPRKTSNGPGNGYKGTTTSHAGQTTANKCGPSDLSSVVSGKDLPVGTLASACNYTFQGTGYIETDIALNRVDHSWSTGACSNGRFDIWTVMVHEFGHGMGLGHTSSIEQDADHDLVMSPGIASCEIKRALGKGDYDGYLKRYYVL